MAIDDNNIKGKVIPFNRVSEGESLNQEREVELIHYVFKIQLDFAEEEYRWAQESDASPAQLHKTIMIMAGIIGGVPNDEAKQMLIDDLKENFPNDDLLLPQLMKAINDIRNGDAEYVPPF
tara:strand:- start:2130 stop:2492 length:363 start_codon:yes stop_codon:yes gene_type:complete